MQRLHENKTHDQTIAAAQCLQKRIWQSLGSVEESIWYTTTASQVAHAQRLQMWPEMRSGRHNAEQVLGSKQAMPTHKQLLKLQWLKLGAQIAYNFI